MPGQNEPDSGKSKTYQSIAVYDGSNPARTLGAVARKISSLPDSERLRPPPVRTKENRSFPPVHRIEDTPVVFKMALFGFF